MRMEIGSSDPIFLRKNLDNPNICGIFILIINLYYENRKKYCYVVQEE